MSKEGGPHVIFGWGEACPDEEVTTFILEGTPPVTDVCEGVVIGPYQPRLAPGKEDDPETLLSNIELEIGYLPEYYYWDGYTDTGIGCPAGGTISFTATDVGSHFDFVDCGLATDVLMSGTGNYDAESDAFLMEVTIGECSYSYERVGEEYGVETTCD
jgi:hypothetical protein